MLEATLRYHLRRDNSDVATMICDNIYVDNLSVGATSIEKACAIYRKAKEIFKGASMNLREWYLLITGEANVKLLYMSTNRVWSRWYFGCPCYHPEAWHSPTCRVLALPQVDLPALAHSA